MEPVYLVEIQVNFSRLLSIERSGKDVASLLYSYFYDDFMAGSLF